ncbi:hypothetical protein PSFL111601_26675 [Pseudomonas floridensis]
MPGFGVLYSDGLAQAVSAYAISTISGKTVGTYVIGTIGGLTIWTNAVSTISGKTVGAYVIGTIGGLTIWTDAVSAIGGKAVGTYMVGTIGGLTVWTDAISTIGGNANRANVSVLGATFSNDGRLGQITGGTGGHGWQCERAGSQNGEGDAEDQFVGFHESVSNLDRVSCHPGMEAMLRAGRFLRS